MQVELAVCNLEIYSEALLLTVVTSLSLTVIFKAVHVKFDVTVYTKDIMRAPKESRRNKDSFSNSGTLPLNGTNQRISCT